MQGARALDLLGAGFADRFPDSPIRYVLYNPLFVDSGMHRNFGRPMRAIVGTAARLTALRRGVAVDPRCDSGDAARLYARLAALTS